MVLAIRCHARFAASGRDVSNHPHDSVVRVIRSRNSNAITAVRYPKGDRRRKYMHGTVCQSSRTAPALLPSAHPRILACSHGRLGVSVPFYPTGPQLTTRFRTFDVLVVHFLLCSSSRLSARSSLSATALLRRHVHPATFNCGLLRYELLNEAVMISAQRLEKMAAAARSRATSVVSPTQQPMQTAESPGPVYSDMDMMLTTPLLRFASANTVAAVPYVRVAWSTSRCSLYHGQRSSHLGLPGQIRRYTRGVPCSQAEVKVLWLP